jgi:hypothetical protein
MFCATGQIGDVEVNVHGGVRVQVQVDDNVDVNGSAE